MFKSQFEGSVIYIPEPPSAIALTVYEGLDLRDTFVHLRGDFLKKGAGVNENTPEFLPPLTPRGDARGDRTADRLDLARWLVDGNHPLTARGAVNRFWQHLFGNGLVRTPEDFGTKGAPPAHPELIDWLAEELIESGWQRKA